MAQGKIYRNSSNLTTPPAIQGPEVSATWRRTCRGGVLMTVQMPQDTVDSEVYVKTPRGHSAVTMDPWTSSTWRKPWNKYHTPNKVTKDKLNRFATTEDTQRYQSQQDCQKTRTHWQKWLVPQAN